MAAAVLVAEVEAVAAAGVGVAEADKPAAEAVVPAAVVEAAVAAAPVAAAVVVEVAAAAAVPVVARNLLQNLRDRSSHRIHINRFVNLRFIRLFFDSSKSRSARSAF